MNYLESYSKKERANFQMPQDHVDKKKRPNRNLKQGAIGTYSRA